MTVRKAAGRDCSRCDGRRSVAGGFCPGRTGLREGVGCAARPWQRGAVAQGRAAELSGLARGHRSARRTIHFESYIIHEDETGKEFARALMARARAGVRVRVIYDWLGAVGKTSRGFWRALREGGMEVRCFNPPGLSSPFAWIVPRPPEDARRGRADRLRHRTLRGPSLGRPTAARGIEPWRDTGISLRGPAVADLELAFARMWALIGLPLADAELSAREARRPRATSRCASSRACRAPRSSTGWTSSLRPPADGPCGSPTPTSSARPPTCNPSARRLVMASTCACWYLVRATSGSCGPLRAGTAPSSRGACGSTSGTAPCSMPRPRSRTGDGRVSARRI